MESCACISVWVHDCDEALGVDAPQCTCTQAHPLGLFVNLSISVSRNCLNLSKKPGKNLRNTLPPSCRASVEHYHHAQTRAFADSRPACSTLSPPSGESAALPSLRTVTSTRSHSRVQQSRAERSWRPPRRATSRRWVLARLCVLRRGKRGFGGDDAIGVFGAWREEPAYCVRVGGPRPGLVLVLYV